MTPAEILRDGDLHQKDRHGGLPALGKKHGQEDFEAVPLDGPYVWRYSYGVSPTLAKQAL